MWLRLTLLLFYIVSVVLLALLLQLHVWLYSGEKPSQQLALALVKIKYLKSILETRGVMYSNVVEKSELEAMVEASGNVTRGELQDTSRSTDAPVTTYFTSSTHFTEEVEQTKSCVWLVQIIPDHVTHPTVIDEVTWRTFFSKVNRFNVRGGVFYCYLDRRLCARRKWLYPQLLLSLPRTNIPRESAEIVSASYTNLQHASGGKTITTKGLYRWLDKYLSSRVKHVSDWSEVKNKWLRYGGDGENDGDSSHSLAKIRVLLVTSLEHVPLFLAALAVRFTGRISFGMVQTKAREKDKDQLKLNPGYYVITPENVVRYGSRPSEKLNYGSFGLFLRMLAPEMNDGFLLSVCLVNAWAVLGWFLIAGSLWKHVVRCLWEVWTLNASLFMVWLLLYASKDLYIVKNMTSYLQEVTRHVCNTDTAAVVRGSFDEVLVHRSILPLLFIMVGVIGFCIQRLAQRRRQSDLSPWWNVFPMDSFITNYLFRPVVVGLTRPVSPTGANSDVQDDWRPTREDRERLLASMTYEERLAYLLEHLSLPRFLLRSLAPENYIEHLPVWPYKEVERSVDSESSALSDSESGSGSSLTMAAGRRRGRTDGEDSESSTNDEEVPDPPRYIMLTRKCSICLGKYKRRESVCGLPCGHNFHQNCVEKWLRDYNHFCPMCRHPAYWPARLHPRN